MKKLYLIQFLILFLAWSVTGQEWVVYDCSVLPDASTFAFSESNVAGDPASNVILDDLYNPGNKILELISPGADPGKFMWKYDFPNDVDDSLTIIMRIKGTSDTLDRTMELDVQQGGFRERLYIKNDMEYELKECGIKLDLTANPLDWHIIRFTKEADTITIFIDENPVPVAAGRTGTTSGSNYFRFGDGNGSSTLGGLVDWIAWDTTGAYAPGEGAGIPDSLAVDVPGWLVYAANETPDLSSPDFSESNVSGDQATSTILADGEHPGNNILELLSPGESERFMWKFNFNDDDLGPFTMVARVKKVSDTLDRTMEFDIQQAGFRERIFLRDNGEYEVKESGVREDLPVGVLGWHLYRINKDYDTVNFYVDENPVPVASVVTKTTTSDNYWRFGDGNGSSTLGGLVDWIIWDTTGAYAPGRGYMIPDSLITTVSSSDATLSDLTVSSGTLEPAFSSGVTNYTLTVDRFATSVTLTGTANDAGATVEGDGEVTDIPGTVTVTVTAEDGYQMEYKVTIKNMLPDWVVYTGDLIPYYDPIGFDSSNVDGDPATNTILDDPDNPGNKLLELISPGADPGKFMWKHNLPNDVNDSITLVVRVKKVSDTLDRTMEFDIQQAGYRERIFLRNNGEYEVKEAGVREDLPVGVLGWHVYRINKAGDSVNFYIDENPEPISSTISGTTSGENYFRFGDGNGSSTLGGVIDWIIWDTTGAYAPGNHSMIPDSLVTDASSSNAMLSDLVASDGVLDPAFSADVMEYTLTVAPGTESVTFTATAEDANATVDGDGEYTEIPGTAEIEVTAEDGYTVAYSIDVEISSPDWVVYDCSVLPDASALDFSESNVDGDPASNTILDDPDHSGNKLLELISPGADPGKFMWKHTLPNDVNDPFTLVMRVKKVSDTLDRTMELDIQQAGFRERIYLRDNGEYEIKEAGVRKDLPVGVLGWHMFRINKEGDSVNFYIDENPEPIASTITETTSGENYFRFGDGNGSSTLGGVIDWIIWDTSGAYAPGILSLIPDSLVTDVTPSDATLSGLTTTTGTLSPAFNADSMDYDLELEVGTVSVTLTATATDAMATVEGDGEFTSFPVTTTIVVTAQDGMEMEYVVNITRDATGINVTEENLFRIFPNPADDVIHVQYQGSNTASFELYDMMGKLVLNLKISQDMSEIDVSGLREGMYILRLDSGSSISIQKLIIR